MRKQPYLVVMITLASNGEGYIHKCKDRRGKRAPNA